VAGTAKLIMVAYGLAVLIAVALSLALAASTRKRVRPDTGRLAEFEKRWLLIVVTILVALLAATIWFTPYGRSTAGAQVVQVQAQQFFWQIRPARVRAGVPVAFETTSKDVNHGFGIYRGHRFIAQIQVVPGETSTLVQTFDRPGTYDVLCLEYCGLDHHTMVATFQVTR
jgi:cytochrome c oxidase subunit 2